MRTFVVFCYCVIYVLTKPVVFHSDIVLAADNKSATARISARATVNSPAGTLWMTNPSTTEISTNTKPLLMLRMPRSAAAQVVFKTDGGIFEQSISPYRIHPTRGYVTGSALLMPLDSMIINLSGATETCTLTVVFPHD
ncbi:MAG: hypothetical protein KOO62_05580 [candidate division Zixibacteria bacterium]|nr:hypothetical protein [candidate division Zixibacteria bacterium]